ncbi:MAG: Fic family protein [Chloroflexi bacterium]|nr:Fic family protein [Chloroflexota bacterium]
MDAKRFVAPAAGQIVRTFNTEGPYEAFVPATLPRSLALAPETVLGLSRADTALGRLAGAGRLLPNPHILVGPYVTREAVASSRIEGTQASLSDVFRATAEGSSPGDVREVQNYVAALNLGLERLATLPISGRLVKELHSVLLDGVRSSDPTPGNFRENQNWIGSPDARPQTAIFVPPPPGRALNDALADWERFTHEDESQLPLLIRCGLLHYYFETIHPFLDGNGRLGRLLIVFFLVSKGVLPRPLLYISSYFEQHRGDYADRLQAVRERYELEEWLQFFLKAIEVQAGDAVERAERLADLRERYRRQLSDTRSRAPGVVELLFENPIVTARYVSDRLGNTPQGAKNLLAELESHGVVQASPAPPGFRKRWIAEEILAVISA